MNILFRLSQIKVKSNTGFQPALAFGQVIRECRLEACVTLNQNKFHPNLGMSVCFTEEKRLIGNIFLEN